jgi:hypothetical protein
MTGCSIFDIARCTDAKDFLTQIGSTAVRSWVNTPAVALAGCASIVVLLVLIPAFLLSLVVPFYFLAAWMARKPQKFVKQDKWLGGYMAVAGVIPSLFGLHILVRF